MSFIPHPDLTKLINAIKKWIALPCSPTPLIYLELALASAVNIFFAYEEPDLREGITQVTGRSAACHVKGIVKQATGFPSNPQGIAKRFLLPLVGAADLSTYYLFLVGIGADGLADFFGGAAKYNPCTDPLSGRHWGYGNLCVGGWPVYHDGRWQTGPQWRTINWPDEPAAGPQITVRQGFYGTITGTCQCGITGTITTVPFKLRVRWEDDPTAIIAEADYDFDPLLVSFKTTIFAQAFNGTPRDRVMVMEISFPPDLAGPSITTRPQGHGFARG